MNKPKAKSLLLIVLVITVIFASQLGKIKFNYDFDMFFPEGDDNFTYYEEYKRQFGEDNDYLLVAIPEENWSSASFLQKVDSTIKLLETWPEIKTVHGLTNQYRYQITPLGANRLRIINPRNTLDTLSFFQNGDYVNQFVAKNRKSVALNIHHNAFKLKARADDFYQRLESHLSAHFSEDVIISGKIEAQYYFVKKLERELVLFLALSIGLIAIILFLIFRTIKGVVLPFVVLTIASVWNLGLIAALGKEMDVMMVMVPPILLVVAMSDVIHFCSKYNELKSIKKSTLEAIIITWKSVGAATFLTSISTAVGFATLTISPLPPIRDFGFYTAIGVIIAYLVTFSFLPPFLFLFDKPLNRSLSSELKWSRWMHDLFRFVLREKRLILRIAPIIMVILASGIFFLRQNTFIVVGLKKSDPLLEKISFFDEQYGGSKSFEMVLTLNQGNLFDEQSLQEIDKVTNYLTKEYGLNYPISGLQVIKELNQGLHAGQIGYRRIPDKSEMSRIKRLYSSRSFEEVRSKLQTDDGSQIRISARSKDIGSYAARRKNAGLADFFKNEINEEIISYRLTGTSFLVDNTDNYVVSSLTKGLAIGLLIISLFLAILFRNLKLTLISLIPNFIPLIILAGILGFLKIDLNITTMLIFGIAFGIAVDDSIHFLSRFQQERRLGKSNTYAIKRTFISTGKSIVLTTIILAAGFGMFLFSGFSATYFTGIFVGFTLLIALVADLLVLPLLLLGKSEGRSKARQG